MARSAVTQAREGFTVAGALSEFSEAQLLTLLRARPDLSTPPPKDLAILAVRASTWASINASIVTLDRASQDLLDALCLLPRPTTASALRTFLGTDLDANDLNAAIKRLADIALVFRRGLELWIHPQIESHQYPAGLGPPASGLLYSQTATVLEAAARRLGVQPGRTKADTLTAVVSALGNPTRLLEALKGAPTGTPELVAQLAEHPEATVPSGTYQLRPNSPLKWLVERALIVAVDWETVVMPREVGLAFRGGRPFPHFSLRPPAVDWRPIDPGAVDRGGREQALRVVADIATILDAWDDAPPKLLKAGGLGVREIRRAATAVGRSEVEVARLIELAAVAGLAGWDLDAETANALPLPAYDEWLELDAADRWVAVVTAWLATELHINVAGAIGTNDKPIPPLLDRWPEQQALPRRKLVLAVLLEGDPGQAPDADTLAARVLWDAPTIWSGGPARPRTLISWVREEAEMLGVCASGALSSLGRAVASGRVDEAVAELSAHAPRLTSQFVIQADLTAVASGPLASAIRSEIELMADLESSGAATVYRFGEQSLRRAFDAGRSATQIVEFLEAHATKGVPQPLSYLVDDVGRRHGRVRVGWATSYLRSDDPALLAEILMNRRTTKLAFRQLAPTVLVSGTTPETVVATLRATGYLPAEEGSTGDLIVQRREEQRGGDGHGHVNLKPGGLADQLAQSLAQYLEPGRLAAFMQSVGGGKASKLPDQRDLAGLVRRLRASRPSPVPASKSTPTLARPINGSGGTPRRSPVPASLPQLKLLRDGSERPREIARSRDAILELLELSHKEEWMLRLEYTAQRGRGGQLNAIVFSLDDKQVTVGTMPGYGTRTLTLNRIVWARAMTEAEEEAL